MMHVEYRQFEFDDLSVSQQAALNLVKTHLDGVTLERSSSRGDLECWVSAVATRGQSDHTMLLQFLVDFKGGPVKHLGPPIPVDINSFPKNGWARFPVFELVKQLFQAKYHHEPIFEEVTTG